MTQDDVKIRRPAIRPLSEWVEQFILSLGIGELDLAKPEVRAKLTRHTAAFWRSCLQSTLFSLKRGADRGLDQTLDFMFDPDHAESAKKRRAEKKQRRVRAAAETHITRLMKEQKELGKVQ